MARDWVAGLRVLSLGGGVWGAESEEQGLECCFSVTGDRDRRIGCGWQGLGYWFWITGSASLGLSDRVRGAGSGFRLWALSLGGRVWSAVSL